MNVVTMTITISAENTGPLNALANAGEDQSDLTARDHTQSDRQAILAQTGG